MVACALALVTELKAWKLTPDFCLQEGINFSSGLRCREELEFYESQEQGEHHVIAFTAPCVCSKVIAMVNYT